MGGKHLKRVRAEKSKVHLKKKLLPKGQNVTQTAFTVKKIVTVEQLKKVDENEPVSNWNVPLKDLLIRMNHYNFTSRLNSLNGMKEILKKFPEILEGPHLKLIIERLLGLITDVEHKIRIMAINLLSHIFDLIPPISLIPLHAILVVHLRCAMTHRTASVQQDSLKFIDVLIKYSPEAVKHNFKSITENFTRILKNYLHECHSGTHLPKGSQQNLEKIKTEALLKFYEFLNAGLCLDVAKKEISRSTICNVNISVEKMVPLRGIKNQYKQIPNLSLLSKILEKKEKVLTENDSEGFQSICTLVIPLLFDTWKEFSPNQINSECMLSEDIGALLLVLLKIILLFYDKMVALKDTKMEHWFLSNYGSLFNKSFTDKFPYLSVSNKNLKSSLFSETLGASCDDFLVQNLIICFLSYSFKIVKKGSQMQIKMENFLVNALQKKNQTETEILLKVIEAVINASKYKKSNTFLSNVVAAYNATHNPELQVGLSKAIFQIISEEDAATYLNDISIKQWMKSLPDCLCDPQIFVEQIQTVLELINKPIGNEILKEVECKAEEIMMNLSNTRIEGAPQLEGQKLIAHIIYRCNNQVLDALVNNRNLINSLHPPELKNYIENIFSQKLVNREVEFVCDI